MVFYQHNRKVIKILRYTEVAEPRLRNSNRIGDTACGVTTWPTYTMHSVRSPAQEKEKEESIHSFIH